MEDSASRFAVVGIVGRTNGGKSTLLNKIVGEKVSIVSPVVQTTRNSIRAVLDDRRGQIVFVDTPGLHKSESKLGALINRMARHTASNVDFLVLVFDISEPPRMEDEGWMRKVASKDETRPVYFFFNKCDREEVFEDRFLALWDTVRKDEGNFRAVSVFRGSASTGEGVARLVDSIFDKAPIGERLYPEDMLSDYPRQLAMADIIREKVFLSLREELPHEVGVRIDSFAEKGDRWHVAASLIVNRPSQKSIVIGPGGKTVRNIRLKAKKDIEEQFSVSLDLELWVKVARNWAENHALLRQMGYLGDY